MNQALHIHRCRRCEQAELHCAQDDCHAPSDWQCFRCDDEERDEFFQALELEELTPRPMLKITLTHDSHKDTHR